MLRTRLLVIIVLLPIAVALIAIGGWLYIAGVFFILTGAGDEYVHLMHAGGRAPVRPLVWLGIWMIGLTPLIPVGPFDRAGLAGFLVLATFWHLIQFERGAQDSAWDWAATVAGVFYIGGLGSFFLSLRTLPGGQWWMLTVLPAIWLSDGFAYIMGVYVAGRALGIGRHAMAPRLSPRKTWEGFAAGLVGGVLGGGLVGALWLDVAGPGLGLGFWPGLLVGLAVSLLGPVGDLGISMIKRQVGVKDSGAALAGHGGMLDRMDSWLVAGAVGYFCVLLLTG
jgi:phosphatidate cytidylyltransferase